MKVGDKIHSKDGQIFLVVGVNDWGEPGLEVIDIKLPWSKERYSFATNRNNLGAGFRQFSDYFYTEQEYRKLKLEKIKTTQKNY